MNKHEDTNRTEPLNEADETQDIVGDVLAALDHIAVIADDLYSVIGDDSEGIDEDTLQAILNAYELLTDVYDKIDADRDMPSSGYDADEVDSVTAESTMFESKTWKAILTRLSGLGFEPARSVTEHNENLHVFSKGDSFFQINAESTDEPFSVIHGQDVKTFKNIVEAISALTEAAKKFKFNPSKHKVVVSDKRDSDGMFSISVYDKETESKRLHSTRHKLSQSKDDGNAYTAGARVMDATRLLNGNLKEDVISENTAWKSLVKKLGGMGLKQTDVASGDFPEGDGISLLFGIPMRAGKFADTWFAISTNDANPYIIKTPKGVQKFDTLSKAVAAMEGMAKGIKESINWSIIEDAGDNEMVAGLRRIREQGFIGLAENVKIEEILAETVEYDADLTQAIVEFRDSLTEANKPEGDTTDADKAKEDSKKCVVPQTESVVPNKKSIQTWNLAKGQMDPYRLEVIGQDGSDVARILDKVLPGNTVNLHDDQLGFKSTAEREKAAKALVDFYKNLKEEDSVVVPLGDISEAFDEAKFKKLAQTGLVDEKQISKVIRAMKTLEDGKPLPLDQKDLITSTFLSLIGLVTGDASVFAKIQGAAKKGATA